jgi:DNA primase
MQGSFLTLLAGRPIAGAIVEKGLIPDEIINRIRERADIKEVVEAHLSLTKAGQNYKGLCPFHSEKTPSFTVSPSRQMFHCFGCGAGGNVFTFLMKMDGLTFPAAVRALGEKVGILVEEKATSPATRQRAEQRERLLGLQQAAADLFHRTLLSDPAAEPARAYLGDRGITPATIERFSIGYALPAWEWLGKAMIKTGWKAEDLAVAGLIVARDSAGRSAGEAAGYYDRFRGRVLFPIRDLQKRVIGFGGRVLDHSEPKYLNSPETPLFSKGRTLYGLEAAREGITRLDHVVVVEGYFDAVALHQAGLTNVVATLGTALTEDHVELIRRFTRRVVLLFDPDAAGVRAALRTMDLFLGSGLSVQVGSLPPGDDPDTFIRTRGVEAFADLVGRAPSLLEFAVQGSLTTGLQGGVDDRVRCVEEVLSLLQKLGNPVEKAAALRHVADQLGMDEKVLLERYRMLPRRGGAAATPSPAGADSVMLPKDEHVLVHLLLHNALPAEMLAQLAADDFTDLRARHLVALALQAQEQAQGTDGLTRALEAAADDPVCGGIARALSLSELPYDNAGAAFRESLKALKLRRIGNEIQDVKAAQATAERAGHSETFRTLLLRMNALQQERQRLLASAPSSRTDVGRVNA